MLASFGMHTVAMAWWIATRGGVQDLAVFSTTMAASSMVLLPVAARMVEGRRKGFALAVALLAMAVEGLALALMAASDSYRLDVVLALEGGNAFAHAVVMTASSTIALDLAPGERLMSVLGWQKSAQAIGRAAGPGLAALLLFEGAPAHALLISGGVQILCSVLAFGLPGVSTQRPAGALVRDLLAGFRAKWKIPLERHWTLTSFLVMVPFTPAAGLLLPLKVVDLGLSGSWLGACEAASAVGMLVGALGVAAWLARRIGRYRAIVAAVCCEALAFVGLGLCGQGWQMLVALFLFGFSVSTMQLVGQSHRMAAMPRPFVARMTGANLVVIQLAGAVGNGLMGLALPHAAVGTAYVVCGLLVLVGGTGFTRIPDFREFLQKDAAEVQEFYGARYPSVFGKGEA